MNEEHAQTHGTEFPIPNDLVSQLMNYVKKKNCKQVQQPVRQARVKVQWTNAWCRKSLNEVIIIIISRHFIKKREQFLNSDLTESFSKKK